MSGPQAPAIAASHLTKRYGPVAALTDLTLEVPAGSIYGFLGPNGAGKSTTMSILAGLSRPTSGSATVAGIPVTPQGAHRAALGYLAQEPRFYDWMSGRETLEYVAGFYPSIDAPRRRADELLGLVGLTDAARRPTKTYSGGMRQRLGIAQALVGRPKVVILDEPAAALDPLGRRDVLALLEGLRDQATVLYSTHILEDVERLSDHVAILDRGRLLRAAPTQELLGSFTRDHLEVTLGGATPDTAVALATLPGVAGVTAVDARDGAITYDVATRPDQAAVAQAAVTRFAADGGLVLVRNARETLDLEAVFLRLVNRTEAAA